MSAQRTPPLLETLMGLVLNSIIFLELSGEDIVDLRSAVKGLEYTAYELNKLSPEDRAVFLAYAQQMAAEEDRPEVRELLLSLDTAMFPDGDTYKSASSLTNGYAEEGRIRL